MSWLYDLYQTYENNLDEVGIVKEKYNRKYTLLPISHNTQDAHIEVTIDPQGNFLQGNVIEKKDSMTIIPCTADSAYRSNGIYPHMLHDKLKYVAGDYDEFTDSAKTSAEFHEKYIDNLKDWCVSDFSHEDVNSVYEYLVKGQLISDLVKASILHIDGSGNLIPKWSKEIEKVRGEKPQIFQAVTNTQEEAFVRFTVSHSDEEEVPLWENRDVQSQYVEYSKTLYSDYDWCYVTGEKKPKTEKHPKYIRYPGDSTKLISANEIGFNMFAGRFNTGNEAVNVSYEVSQKAHNALKWLIRKQGRNLNGQVLLVWGDNKESLTVPAPTDGSLALHKYFKPLHQKENVVMDRTSEAYAKELYKAIEGFKNQMPPKSNMKILIVDSATDKGRLAVTYYQNLKQSDYWDKIKHWHSTCNWRIKGKSEERSYEYYGTPSIYDIFLAAYGSKASEVLNKKAVSRLMPCIFENQKIPRDLINAAYYRAINPGKMEQWEWLKTINTTCALIRKQNEKEGYQVSLDYDKKERDYLFGRLLAVADVLERKAKGYRYIKRSSGMDPEEKDEDNKIKKTNATLYMQAFSRHPARTWQILYMKMIPYFNMFDGNGAKYMELIDEITASFDVEDFTDQPLTPEHLIGFSSQRMDLLEKKKRK